MSEDLIIAAGVPGRFEPAFPALSDCTALLDEELLEDEFELDELLLGVPFPHAATLITVARASTPTAMRFLNDIPKLLFVERAFHSYTAIVADEWFVMRREEGAALSQCVS